MNQDNIGKYIKNIRLKNKLTQEAFAESLHVTAQAVSKWELGKNMPDLSILNEISKRYNIDIDELLNGKKKKKNNYIIIVAIIVLIIIGVITFLILTNKVNDYKFRDLSSLCDEYKIAGIAAYDAKKSSIYISNIEYCGEEDLTEKYDSISCTLYETYNNITKKISSCEKKENMTLNEYLKSITIKVENYLNECKEFDSSNLYLEIEALGQKNYNHKIPLKITTCNS